ncbi:MAG: Holliday junction resolvase RuvX [Clostridia bacterium]|nr:Holliday junction resolvase RuvX [Clostridia bacterium]MBR5976915.1 Holliday junction resolvase RuvX [Clostridia bacterium]MBR6479601.1 Holliday junction resolvase RuvX [Clostridia bacterium]MBR6512650.1 Holliday junction resolvase RuvX [Clostridia bacterium]
MVILGIDYGYARTGVAACDALEVLASPVEVIRETYMPHVAKRISEIASERNASLVVVGLPLNMDGSFGEHAEASKMLAEILKTEYGIDVELFDERLTTVEAYGLLNEAGTFGKKRRDEVDMVAATIILNDFLSARKNGEK